MNVVSGFQRLPVGERHLLNDVARRHERPRVAPVRARARRRVGGVAVDERVMEIVADGDGRLSSEVDARATWARNEGCPGRGRSAARR